MRIRRVFLPNEQAPPASLVNQVFPETQLRSCSAVNQLVGRMRRFLGGEAIGFALGLVALESCSEFQRRVLLLEHDIPRGWVSTYGRLAEQLGIRRASRAVGSALARSPFPIIIPCHRAVRSGGELGGYQGGIGMKRALLELEGNVFGRDGRILSPRMFY
jgi:methylated-DNA-[protein]-cysteine S-methyltransferase